MKSLKNKVLIFAVILIGLLFAALSYIEARSERVVPILMYHSIHPDKEKGSLYVTPDAFRKQMDFLAKYKYNVVGPEKVIAYMKGEEKMPPRTVAITADDGYYNFYKYAFPVLKKHNFKSTVFIVTNQIGRPGRLGWKELREISESGLVTIGSHSKSHPWMPEVSVDEKRLKKELVTSKEILERGLHKKVYFFCYPNGGFNDLVKEAAEEAGYKGAFTTNPRRNSEINDIYAIRRLKMSSPSTGALMLWGKISKYYAWFKERR